jgi:choline dehydrogenase-like flavoprotein
VFTDAGRIPRGSTVASDVCIVGGGPTGITLALRLAHGPLTVTLLESGGESSGGDAQALNRGASVGLPYFGLDETRFRGLGGTSSHWAGWCRPLDPIDMERRPWMPLSGWPITRDELDPYYTEAARLCELEHEDFSEVAAQVSLSPVYRPPIVAGDVKVAMWHASPPTKFGVVYRPDLAQASNVTVITGATAVAVSTDEETNRATGAVVRTLDGNEFEVNSRVVVLCAGAMETARILLASRPGGLGNEHDLVGRHFMEHPHVVTGMVDVAPRRERQMAVPALDRSAMGTLARLRMLRPTGSTKVAYVLDDAKIRSEELLAFAAHFQTVSAARDSEAYQAMKLVIGNLRSPRRLARQIRTRSLPAGTGRTVGRMIKGLPQVAGAVYQEVLRRPRVLGLYVQAEQSPNPISRVTLDTDRPDELGMPRLRLDWRLSALDKRSIMRSQQILGERLAAAGVGSVAPTEPFRDDGPDWGDELGGGHHHMGTARMADDPRHGVVDRNGLVHTVADLYVGDSSVFPTGGYANPMLTSVALSLRLADRLKAVYGRE